MNYIKGCSILCCSGCSVTVLRILCTLLAMFFQVGLEKLLAAEKDVGIMKQELIELQPKLIETGKHYAVGRSVILPF